tara:strand:+ start:988 stop:1203 length:216 start_codon:yes stop_codon:yes gene_type:complete
MNGLEKKFPSKVYLYIIVCIRSKNQRVPFIDIVIAEKYNDNVKRAVADANNPITVKIVVKNNIVVLFILNP